jgi:acyl-coenzyme A thioesterase PaaI-like protein
MHVTFLRPIRPGKAFARGRLVHRVGDTAYLEASLSDANGVLVARATATALVIPLDQARTAA